MRDYTKGVRKPPSAAHLCRLVGRSAEETAKRIIAFQDADLNIRTWPAVEYLRQFLSGGDIDFLVGQAALHKNKHMGRAAIECLPLLQQYKRDHEVSWFNPLGPTKIVLSQNLTVPLKPIGQAGVDGQIILLAGQVWKNQSLDAFSFQLWRSIAQMYLDSQLDAAGFHWLEMSAPYKGADREMVLRTHDTVDPFTELEMAAVINNVEQAMEIVRSVPPKKWEKKPDPKQGTLFGEDGEV